MFGLFKKTSWKIEGKAHNFFKKVFEQLPSEFQFLSKGLDDGLYRKFSVNHSLKENSYFIIFNPLLSDKSTIKGKLFEIENIIIIQNGQEFPLNITIDEGLWIGFEISKNILDFFDFQVDTSFIRKSNLKFLKDTKIENLVIGLTSEQLDLTNLSEFDIEGKIYYEIKDLNNGNFIAIDNNGKVFWLIHDPYKIKLINISVRKFVDDVNNGQFNFEDYLNDPNF
jgi:hypothetical protein